MSTLLDLTSRKVNITYISDAGCTVVNSKNILNVEPVTARSSRVSWVKLPDIPDEELFYIQKSASPESGWVTLAKKTSADAPHFLDEDANNSMNRHEHELYRILCPISLKVFGIAKCEGYIDLYGAEMARRHRIYLEKGRGGNRCYAFIKMRNGSRCPECWDEILQQRSKVNCTACNDTGFLVGYYNPILVYVSFGPEQIAIQQDVDGPNAAPDTVQAWTSNYPLLNVGDVIVEVQGKRFWYIGQIGITMHKRVVTRQELALNKQEGDDPLLRLISRLPKEELLNG